MISKATLEAGEGTHVAVEVLKDESLLGLLLADADLEVSRDSDRAAPGRYESISAVFNGGRGSIQRKLELKRPGA